MQRVESFEISAVCRGESLNCRAVRKEFRSVVIIMQCGGITKSPSWERSDMGNYGAGLQITLDKYSNCEFESLKFDPHLQENSEVEVDHIAFACAHITYRQC